MDTLEHHLCIVLAHEDAGDLRDLVEQLATLDCRIEQYDSAAEAFARLCLCHRAYTTAMLSEANVGSVDRPALVVVDPAAWPQLPNMLAASDEFLPLAIWQWRDGSLEMLRPGSPDRDRTSPETNMPKPQPGGQPQLRLSEPFIEPESPSVVEWSDPLPALDDPSSALEADDDNDPEDTARLTAQELDMLLDTRRPEDGS